MGEPEDKDSLNKRFGPAIGSQARRCEAAVDEATIARRIEAPYSLVDRQHVEILDPVSDDFQAVIGRLHLADVSAVDSSVSVAVSLVVYDVIGFFEYASVHVFKELDVSVPIVCVCACEEIVMVYYDFPGQYSDVDRVIIVFVENMAGPIGQVLRGIADPESFVLVSYMSADALGDDAGDVASLAQCKAKFTFALA